jgi:hypothetical protein
MVWMDKTFCASTCYNTACDRHSSHVRHIEDYLSSVRGEKVAWAEFAEVCDAYVPIDVATRDAVNERALAIEFESGIARSAAYAAAIKEHRAKVASDG